MYMLQLQWCTYSQRCLSGTKDARLNLVAPKPELTDSQSCFTFTFIYSGNVMWANVTFSSDAPCHIRTLTCGGCSVQPEVFAVNCTSAVTCKTACSKTTQVVGGEGTGLLNFPTWPSGISTGNFSTFSFLMGM